MEQLKRYCTKIKSINGKMTYIVDPMLLEDILADAELFVLLGIPSDFVRHKIKEAKAEPQKIFLAFVQHSHVKMEKYRWEPVHCYKDGEDYYHVYIRDSWLCRECQQMNYGKFLQPAGEHDPLFYSGAENQYPRASVFKKRRCRHCGKNLQIHFIEPGKESMP